ncbi:DUF5683 domain-containing protein [Carboxylicivirga sp. M1479]|uniref:DUF5683 domain-containing protein n=1 Tax=Carboxylicivirga sp. M1479 TaxID=2594476 RepID=UPI001178090C|nr:DUF5683 domain-containing protein [Carboxylicivirga sp. M1479]TRX72205.1 hypothetical protein FNN09_02205 [Carboxylicivirga sp. M1479]
MTVTNKYYWLWCCVALFFLSLPLTAQRTEEFVSQGDTAILKGVVVDTPVVEKKHSPHKASFYAAILPGMGQAYNKKYWKIPILYAGIGGVAYGIHFNTKYYNKYKAAYRDFVIRDPGNKSYLEFIPPNLSEEQIYGEYEQWFEEALNSKKQYYRRYRDLSYIGMIGLYVLQIVDASVDAHFNNFDISDDLSMQVQPSMMPPVPGDFAGVGLQLKFKF